MKIPWPPSFSCKKIVLCFVSVILLLPHSGHPVELNQVQTGSSKKMLSEFDENLKNAAECPQMIPRYIPNVHPRAGFNKEQIQYKKKEGPKTKEECVQLCCNLQDCQIVFMYTNITLTCFHVSDELF